MFNRQLAEATWTYMTESERKQWLTKVIAEAPDSEVGQWADFFEDMTR